MKVTFGFLTRTDSYSATIPDTMVDGSEQTGSVTLAGLPRTVEFSPDPDVAKTNGQVADGAVDGVDSYTQVGTATLDTLMALGPAPMETQTTLVPSLYGSADASFTITPNPANIGDTISFQATGGVSGGFSCRYPDATYSWDLDGDGALDTGGYLVTNVYSDTGSIPISLQVESSCGPIDTNTQLLVINTNPDSATSVDVPEIKFLYWPLGGGVVFTHACVSDEGADALSTLATNISPHLDAKGIPRVTLGGALTVGDLAEPVERPSTLYYGTGTPYSVVFTYAGSYAADAEVTELDRAAVTKATTLGVTVTVDGAPADLATLRTQAASIASSVVAV